jgi:Spy/CpxP family protein refolding chaperone
MIGGGAGNARLLGAALLVAVFAAGGLAGAATDRVLHAGETRPPDQAGWDCRPPRGDHTLLDQLALAPEQRVRIDSIMDESRERIRAFWAHEGAQVRAMVDSTRAEVRSVLTPEQRAEYDRLRAEADQRRRQKHHRERAAPPGD